MPDLSTVVNMFFGADNNKVLYALIILVTLLVSSKRAHRGQKCKLNNKWLSNFLYNKHLGRKNATNDTIEKQEKSEDLCPRFSRIYFA